MLYVFVSVLLFGIGALFLLDLFSFIMDLIMKGVLILFEMIAKWFGISDKFYYMVETWGLYEEGEIKRHNQAYFQATYDFTFEMVLMFVTMGAAIAKFFSRIAIEWFPVIEDLHIDLSWLLIDFSRIARTVFNLLQFTIIFVITRKIRRKIRSKFQDKTDWDSIKCF